MKIATTLILLLTTLTHASAGLISWSSSPIILGADPKFNTINVGDVVALYIDVNGDSGLTGLVVNEDFSVNILNSSSNMADDLFVDISTVGSAVPGFVLGINTKELNVSNGPTLDPLVYTVFFNSSTLSTATLGLISDDAPFNSGVAAPPVPPTSYDALGSDGLLTGNMGEVTVIPEPTIIAMFLIGILCTFGFGRYRRKS